MSASPPHSLRTPLSDWHTAHGAEMGPAAGWLLPRHYAQGAVQEHLATRKYGGLFDLCHMGRFWISGAGSLAFLQHVLSNNVAALAPGRACYTLLADRQGQVIDDAYLYCLEQREFLLAVNADNRQADFAHLKRQADGFPDVVIEDRTEQLALIAIQGPRSGGVLEGLLEGGRLPEPFRNCLAQARFCGTEVLVSRTGYTGEPIGFELFLPAAKAEKLWTALLEAGQKRGIQPVGLQARDTLRLEACLPQYGRELGVDPSGAPLPAYALPTAERAVSFSPLKGDYLGREALAQQFAQLRRLRMAHEESLETPLRRIRPLAVLDEEFGRPIAPGSPVMLGERQVGMVTSCAVVPYWVFVGTGATMHITEEHRRRVIGLAYLDATLRVDREVAICAGKARRPARVVRFHGRSEAPPYFRPVPAVRAEPAPPAAAQTGLAKAEIVLRKSLENHVWRQQRTINLIPSEMTPSPLVRLLQVTDPVGRYAEHRELLAALGRDVFYYQGTDLIAWVEAELREEMARYLGCPLVELRTISGQMANMTVFSGYVDYKNRLDRRREPERIRLAMNNHLTRGGHLSSQPMGALRDYIAKDPHTERYAVVHFPVLPDNPYRIDLERTAELLEELDPELIILGKSMVLHPEPVAEIKRLIRGHKSRPILMYDMAHVLGLVGPHFQQPFAEGADIVTGSTHKTYFGTQRGVIGANFAEHAPEFELWKAIRRRAFPGMVSNHHLGTLLGLLLAAIEMNTFKDEYQRQVIANAKAFARALADEGLHVEGDPAVDYTETHQVIVRVGYAQGCAAAERLEKNHIICNYQALPGDEGFTASSGLRLGVAEMTRFGMKETDFEAFAALFVDALRDAPGAADRVAAFRAKFLRLHYCFDDGPLAAYKQRLLHTF